MCLSLYTQKNTFFSKQLCVCVCTHDWEGQKKTACAQVRFLLLPNVLRTELKLGSTWPVPQPRSVLYSLTPRSGSGKNQSAFWCGPIHFPRVGHVKFIWTERKLANKTKMKSRKNCGCGQSQGLLNGTWVGFKKKTCHPQISNMCKFYMGIGSFSTLRHSIALPHLTTSALELSYGLIKLHRLSYYELKYPTFANKIFLLRNLL